MNKQIKNYCKRCNHQTNHEILYNISERSDNEDYDYIIEYLTVKCLGCERISFRENFVNIEDSFPDENGNWHPSIEVTNYPAKDKIKSNLKYLHALPEKIKIIYYEAIKAYNSDCPILTGAAFRAVIEAISIEEKIPGTNLEKKINSLVKGKLITEKEAKRLHSIRFIGNDSVHEMKVPKNESLILVLNIIEHLLNNLYIIDYDSKQHLETVIDEYHEFESLVGRLSQKFQKGDEMPLAKILEKNVRRFNGKLEQFENELQDKISNGDFTKLSLGKIDSFGNNTTKLQHFVVT